MVILLQPSLKESNMSKVEESNFVHTKQPRAALWHEMSLSRETLKSNASPSISLM
jgi:hypothetical protein